MQSYLQYRRFGQRVEQQLQRDKQKYDLIRAINHGDEAALDRAQRSHVAQDPQADPEKGQKEEDSSALGARDQDHSLEREEVEEHEHPYRNSTSDSSNEEPVNKSEHQQLANLGMSLSRASSRKSNKSMGTKLGHALTGVNVRDRTSKEGGDLDRQVFVVDYAGDDDPMNPHNWSFGRRMGATIIVASIGCVVGLASSIDSSVLMPASEEFGVSMVVESLATGKFPANLWIIASARVLTT